MKNRPYGFDLDSTIADIGPILIKNIQSFLPEFHIEQVYMHDLSICTGLSKVIINLCVSRTLADVDNIKPCEGVIEYIKSLDRKIEIITNRGDMANTHKWLDIYIKGLYNVYFVEGTKVSLIKELGIEEYMEDRVEHAVEIANSGIKVYLYDQRWNRDLGDYPNIERFYSWKEFHQKEK